jgi:glycosyltransferase involved in cell wall biosynthesis
MQLYKNLLIISDTKIQKIGDQYFGFNSVVLELDVFKKLFNRITWIGFDYSDEQKDESLLEIFGDNVDVILLPRSGGRNLLSKLKIGFLIPFYFLSIFKYTKTNEFIHVRGPSGPMFLALLVAKFFRKKMWIVKYANNWSDTNAPFFWKLQKNMMIQQNWIKGTVNGQWPDMPKHLMSFENPCIYNATFDNSLLSKFDKESKTLLFVGRIEFEKGIQTFLESLKSVDPNKIGKIIIAGTGKNFQFLEDYLDKKNSNIEIDYVGSQPKQKVIELMRSSHFLILPTTASEGFPKVVAEAWSVCCIPISSDISSIGQYVRNHENGFIWEFRKNLDFAEVLNDALNFNSQNLKVLVQNGFAESQKFTYLNYENRLKSILNID